VIVMEIGAGGCSADELCTLGRNCFKRNANRQRTNERSSRLVRTFTRFNRLGNLLALLRLIIVKKATGREREKESVRNFEQLDRGDDLTQSSTIASIDSTPSKFGEGVGEVIGEPR
jgi:hypothetical protein